MDEAVARYKRHWEKLREDKDAWEAKKKVLYGRLNEALSKAEVALVKAEAKAATGVERVAKAEGLGHQRGNEEVMGFLREVLNTLAPDFEEDNYFEAYIHYVEECQRDEAEGRDPEVVEFIPPSGKGDEDEGNHTSRWRGWGPR